LYSSPNTVRLAISRSYDKDDLLAWLEEAENAYRLVLEEKFGKPPLIRLRKR
jgi:hypothetical protein